MLLSTGIFWVCSSFPKLHVGDNFRDQNANATPHCARAITFQPASLNSPEWNLVEHTWYELVFAVDNILMVWLICNTLCWINGLRSLQNSRDAQWSLCMCRVPSGHYPNYRQFSNIRRSQSQNINVSRLVFLLSFNNPLKPGVKLRMQM